MIDLLDRLKEGFNADPGTENAYLWSSDSYLAFSLGQWLARAGESLPSSVATSRGYSLRVNHTMIFHWTWDAKNRVDTWRVHKTA